MGVLACKSANSRFGKETFGLWGKADTLQISQISTFFFPGLISFMLIPRVFARACFKKRSSPEGPKGGREPDPYLDKPAKMMLPSPPPLQNAPCHATRGEKRGRGEKGDNFIVGSSHAFSLFSSYVRGRCVCGVVVSYMYSGRLFQPSQQ